MTSDKVNNSALTRAYSSFRPNERPVRPKAAA
jgi:hypothetical protein